MKNYFSHLTHVGIKGVVTLSFVVAITGTFVPVTGFVLAADTNPIQDYTLLEPLPCIPSETTTDSTGKAVTDCAAGTQITSVKFETYVQYIFNLAIAIAAVAAVFMIVYGGFEYMTTDSWQGKSAGIERFRGAITGLLLVLCSFLILRTVNPKLVEINTSGLKPLKVEQSAWSQYYNTILPQLTQMTREKVAENNALIKQNKAYAETYNKLQNDIKTLCAAKNITDEEECNTSDDQEIRTARLQSIQYQNQIQQNQALIEKNIFENEVIVETKKVQGPDTPPAYIMTALGRLDGLYKNATAAVTDPETLADLKIKNDDARLALIKEYSTIATANSSQINSTDLTQFKNYLPEDPTKKQQAIVYIDKIVEKAMEQETINNTNRGRGAGY